MMPRSNASLQGKYIFHWSSTDGPAQEESQKENVGRSDRVNLVAILRHRIWGSAGSETEREGRGRNEREREQ